MNTFVSFFDKTPLNRIISRMSADTYIMDEQIVLSYTELIQVGFASAGLLIWMVIVIPYVIIPFIFIIISLFFIRNYVINIARQFKQYELITRSNIFANINSMIQGIVAIRCYKRQNYFK